MDQIPCTTAKCAKSYMSDKFDIESGIARGLAVAAQVSTLSDGVVHARSSRGQSQVKVFCHASAMRGLEYLNAFRLLAEAGMYEPAAGVLRVLLELVFVAQAIHDDPTKLIELERQDGAEKRKAIESLRRVDPAMRDESITDEMLSQAIKRYGPSTGGFNAFNWAADSNNEASYLTMYRFLNPFSHGSAAALQSYIAKAQGDNATAMTFNLGQVLAVQFLVSASFVMLELLQCFDDGATRANSSYDQINAELKALQAAIYEQPPLNDFDFKQSSLL